MISEDQLKTIFGDDAETLVNYLKNKHKGGNNNSKGNLFENYFAIFRIAELFNTGENKTLTTLTSQSMAFIDDLIIEWGEHRLSSFYQIKDIKNHTWDGGTHSIEKDFIHQETYCKKSGINAKFHLVLSNTGLVDKLTSTIPDSIHFVNVLHFQSASTLSNLISTYQPFRDAIIDLCAISNPPFFQLEALAAILLGSWDSSDKHYTSLQEIADKCYTMNPHYMKGFSGKISKPLESIFNAIPDFKYEIENGFLKWTYQETDYGILSFPIGTTEFLQFESNVTNLGIKNVDFEKIEPYLQ